MRIIGSALITLLLSTGAAWAQAQPVQGSGVAGTPAGGVVTVQGASGGTAIPVTGTFSATLGGFAPATVGTPISVTTGGVTGTLPAGAVVVATNVGTTNGAYCALGASSTTAWQYIAPNGGWFAFTVGAATQLTCITSTLTTTINMVGGAGLPTGTGGGGGGSGGAVTQGTTPWIDSVTTWAGVALGAMANYGTSPGAVAVPGVNAFVTNTNANGQATAANSSPVVIDSGHSVAVSVAPVTATNGAIVVDLRPDSPGIIALGGATTANSVSQILNSQYPVNSVTTAPTPAVVKATGSTGAVTATIAAVASATNYLCGFDVSYVGGVAAISPVTVTGLLGGTWTYQLPVSATGGQVFSKEFTMCLPASGTNVAIAVVTTADATATAVDVNVHGYTE